MSKSKAIIIPVVFVVVSLILVFVGFSELNILSYFDISDFIGVNSGVPADFKSNDKILDELKQQYLSADTSKKFSDDMNAIWIDINEDISTEATEGTDAVKYCIYSDVDYYRNFAPDTYFIKPDIEGEYSELKEPDGSQYDILAYLLYYVRDVGCSAILIADDSVLLDNNGKVHTRLLEKYLSEYKFDGVLISVDASYSHQMYSECARVVNEFMHENYRDLSIGIEIHSDFESVFADNYVTEVFQNKLVDFGYVDIGTTSGNEEYPFQSVALWWNYFSEYYNIPLYCEYRLDKIFSSEGDWSFSNEINNQMKAMYFCGYFDGGCFYNSSQLKNKKALARELAIFINDVAESNNDNFEVNSLALSGRNVQFSGTAADNNSLFCNDNPIKVTEGVFDYSTILEAGLNDFRFFSNGAYYTYSIYDNSPLFAGYPDEAQVRLDADMCVSAFAICPDNSVVFAVVNGEYFELPVVEGYDSGVKGCAYYSAEISFYGKEIYSNDLQLICFSSNRYDIVDCGSIQYELSEESDLPSNGVEAAFSPYSDNGLGTSLMCITKDDNTEIISEADDYDTYHPYNSSLAKGTIDYVEKINVSDGGYLRYELRSGLNIYGTDAVLISEGYNLPLNKVTLTERIINDTGTSFTFDLQWLAPVTVTIKDLEYKSGYQGFAYNIEAFDAEYIDINFYYSDQFMLAQQMLLENDPLFSSYELYADETNSSLIVRMYLREKGKFYGYDITSDEEGNVKIVFNCFADKSLSGKVVMLDAGHGGISMVGTALNDNSVSESQITLGIATSAKRYLEQMGATVIMTRVMDTSLTLSERTYMCETVNPDIFVSIHCDGADDISESGTHTFYYTPFSYNLAQSIHSSIVSAYTNRIYLPADENFASVDRKIKFYPFYVTRVDNCPSVLVETGFLTNYIEGYVLANPTNQDIVGNAVATGISNYFAGL